MGQPKTVFVPVAANTKTESISIRGVSEFTILECVGSLVVEFDGGTPLTLKKADRVRLDTADNRETVAKLFLTSATEQTIRLGVGYGGSGIETQVNDMELNVGTIANLNSPANSNSTPKHITIAALDTAQIYTATGGTDRVVFARVDTEPHAVYWGGAATGLDVDTDLHGIPLWEKSGYEHVCSGDLYVYNPGPNPVTIATVITSRT